eukprot:Gb_36144 [translate_table: standard]
MQRYARLHDCRVHNDEAVFKSHAHDVAEDQKVCRGISKLEYRDLSYQIGDGGSGRLGAAVQRAMALRERQSSPANVEGIGAMRDLYMSWIANGRSTSPGRLPESSSNVEYWADSSTEMLNSRTQSMRYSRFCPSNPDDQDRHIIIKAPDVYNVSAQSSSSSAQKQELCDQRKINATAENKNNKKGFMRLVCRHLFSLRKKSPSAHVS